jgi:hypothetical protein
MNSSSTELFQLLTTTKCFRGASRYIALGGPHGKHHVVLSCIVICMFTDPLPTSRHPIVSHVGSHGNVFIKLLPSNGSVCRNIIKNILW